MKKLNEVFTYDPITGDLTRIFSAGGVYVGDVVGCKRPNGYLMVSINGKQKRAHRVAWELYYGEPPSGDIDHINHVRDDNRICNLRVVTSSENNKNLRRRKNNTTGISGVSWESDRNKWLSFIGVNKKRHLKLGRFSSFFEACCARKSAEVKYEYHKNHGSK